MGIYMKNFIVKLGAKMCLNFYSINSQKLSTFNSTNRILDEK